MWSHIAFGLLNKYEAEEYFCVISLEFSTLGVGRTVM